MLAGLFCHSIDALGLCIHPFGQCINPGIQPLGQCINPGIQPLGQCINPGIQPLGHCINPGIQPLGHCINPGIQPLGQCIHPHGLSIEPLVQRFECAAQVFVHLRHRLLPEVTSAAWGGQCFLQPVEVAVRSAS